MPHDGAHAPAHPHGTPHVHGPGCAHHHHVPRGAGVTPSAALGFAFALNAGFFAFEVVAAWWSRSLTLWADAGHMLHDTTALAFAWAVCRLAARPPSGRYTFGFGRLSVIGAAVSALMLLAVIVGIVVEALRRTAAPVAPEAGWMLAAGAVGLVINVWSALRLHAAEGGGENVRAAMLHLAVDALGSLTAVVSAVALLAGAAMAVDTVGAVLIALVVTPAALNVLHRAFALLMQAAPEGVDPAAVRARLAAHPAVAAVHDLHVWAVDTGDAAVEARLGARTDDMARACAAADELRADLAAAYNVRRAFIEWTPPAHGSPVALVPKPAPPEL